MDENIHYYSYGSYLIHSQKKTEVFSLADSQGDLGHIRIPKSNAGLSALERAAKKICNLKCGLCPVQEDDFAGCHVPCNEEIRPWQCWVAHFKKQAELADKVS